MDDLHQQWRGINYISSCTLIYSKLFVSVFAAQSEARAWEEGTEGQQPGTADADQGTEGTTETVPQNAEAVRQAPLAWQQEPGKGQLSKGIVFQKENPFDFWWQMLFVCSISTTEMVDSGFSKIIFWQTNLSTIFPISLIKYFRWNESSKVDLCDDLLSHILFL